MKPVHFAVSLSSTSCHPRNHNAMANKRFTWTLSEVAQRHIYSTNKLFYTRAHTHTRTHTQTYQKLSQVKQISSCQPSKLKAMIRNRYNQVPNLTQDTTGGSDKNTRKHDTQESQEVSLFPTGDHKAAKNRQKA